MVQKDQWGKMNDWTGQKRVRRVLKNSETCFQGHASGLSFENQRKTDCMREEILQQEERKEKYRGIMQ